MSDQHQHFMMAYGDQIKDLSLQDERRLNSLFLKDKDALEEWIATGHSYKYFQNANQQSLFRHIAKYYDEYGKLLSRENFTSQLKSSGYDNTKITRILGVFDDSFKTNVHPDDYSALADLASNRYVQYQFVDLAGNYLDVIQNASSGQASLVDEFVGKVTNIQKPAEDTYNSVHTLSNVLRQEVLPEIAERREHPDNFKGMLTGWNSLDDIYFGFQKGKYCVFSGMEGGGKTSTMLNLAINMARLGRTVVYVGVESDAKEHALRALTIYSAININRIYRGGKDDYGINDYLNAEIEKATEEMTAPNGLGSRLFIIQVLQGTNHSLIVNMLNRKLAHTNIDVVFWDYLDEIGTEVSFPGRPDLELADVSRRCQNYGKQHNVLSITAQQLTREKVKELQKGEAKGAEFKMGTADISGSKKIAAAADYVFGILLDQETKDRIYLWNAKARHNKSAERFTLSIDTNSGRMDDMQNGGRVFEDNPPPREGELSPEQIVEDPEFQKTVSEINHRNDLIHSSMSDLSSADFMSEPSEFYYDDGGEE